MEELTIESQSVITPYQWHLFLCADQSKPKCCDKDLGLAVWDHLKHQLKILNLETTEGNRVYRTKANCLRACDFQVPGPILLVYPGGYWYHSVTPDLIDQILQEHIISGIPVQSNLFGVKTLKSATPPSTT
jgi:(2Fe-2S) ferredoxin